MTRWSKGILAGVGLVVVTVGPARAQANTNESRATLRGLPGVEKEEVNQFISAWFAVNPKRP